MNIDGTKLTVKENTLLNLTCEISETNPASVVTLLVGDTKIPSKGMTTKPFDEDRKIIYTYTVEMKRNMQNKNVVCESKMNGIDEEYAKRLGNIKYQLSKKFTLDVQCKNDGFFFCF